jgi:predicted RNA-binding protein
MHYYDGNNTNCSGGKMNYWILALPRPHIEHCVKIGTFGMRRKYTLEQVKKDDKVICFATKEAKILGFGKVVREYYFANDKVFLDKNHPYPDRIDFTATLLPSDREIDFKPLVNDLSFVKNKQYWGAHFVSGLCQIPAEDFELIKSLAKV